MPTYEYKVVPAPRAGQKARGVKGTEAQFAHALETLMNDVAAEGWDYLRADTLPCEERQGFRGRTVTHQNMLVFRRMTAEAARAKLQAAVQSADVAMAAAPPVGRAPQVHQQPPAEPAAAPPVDTPAEDHRPDMDTYRPEPAAAERRAPPLRAERGMPRD